MEDCLAITSPAIQEQAQSIQRLAMSLVEVLLEKPATLSAESRYTAMNGLLYLGAGALFLVWPGSVQIVFRDAPFVGHEGALFRVIGMAVAVIGWLYLFGGRSGARQMVAASVLDRLVFVPAVLVTLALAGIFPHVLLALAVLEPTLALGAWALLARGR
jgi:hypothetical protein